MRQEIFEDVQDLTSAELTGAWVGEEIISEVDGTQTYGTKMTSDETCQYGSIEVMLSDHNSATNDDTVTCVITTTEESEVAIDLFGGRSGSREVC